MNRPIPQQTRRPQPLWRPALLTLLLVLGLPWLTSAKGTEWQTYLSDTFTDTTVFPTGQFGEAFYTVENGEYVIDGRNASQDSLSALTDNLYYYNLEAECRVSESTAGELAFTGLVFHYKTTLQKLRSYYKFYVYPDGYYGAARVIGDEVTIVLPLSRSTEINTSGSNTLGVDAQGTRFDLYINGKYVNGFTDVRIDGGGFGFYVSKQTAGAFDNFKVRVEARETGQEEPQMPDSSTHEGTGGTTRGHGRFNIPKDPDRPTYPWEVGAGKHGKGHKGDDEETDRGHKRGGDEDKGAREGPVKQPDEEGTDTVPVVPPDEQVVIPPRPKQRETKPAPPPEPEPEPEAAPEPAPEDEGAGTDGDNGGGAEVCPPDTSGTDGMDGGSTGTETPDDSGDSDTYVTPGGLGMNSSGSRMASADERYHGDGFDKEGAPRKAAAANDEHKGGDKGSAADSDPEQVARPPKSMIALDQPAKASERSDKQPSADDEQARKDQEKRDRQAAKAQREADKQKQKEQEERDREAERERKRQEKAAEEAARDNEEKAAANDSEEIGARPELRADAGADEGTGKRDRLLSSMRSRDWGDEESSSTYVKPRKAARGQDDEDAPLQADRKVQPKENVDREPSRDEAEPVAVSRETEPDAAPEQEPAEPAPRHHRVRDLNVNMGMDGSAPSQSTHAGTSGVQTTGHKHPRTDPVERTAPPAEEEEPRPVPEEDVRPRPQPERRESAKEEARPALREEPEDSGQVPPVDSTDSADIDDHGDTILLTPQSSTDTPVDTDNGEATPEQGSAELATEAQPEPEPVTKEPRHARLPGELSFGASADEEDSASQDAFAKPQADEPAATPATPADLPPAVATPELGHLPLAPPTPAKPGAKPAVTVSTKTGFFHLTDDFSQQRWPVSDNGGSSYRYFGAAYQIDNLKSQTMAISFQEEHMGEMAVSVGSDFLDGAAYVGYGVAARFSNGKQGINYYGLFVSQTGECLLLRVLNGDETVLVDWTASTAFKASQRNTLKIDVSDGSVRGYVNGQLAVQAKDDSLPPGGYALLAGPGISVRFDDLDLAGVRE